MKYDDGSVFEGKFLFGKKWGSKGKLTNPDGTYHEGEFVSDKIWNGKGTVKHENG